MKKLLASGAAALLALGGLVATAAPASAHTPRVTADCAGLEVRLTQYSDKANSVVVKVDGKVVKDESFKRSWSTSYAFPDTSVGHSWELSVKASDGKQFDFSDDGATPPCAGAPTPKPGKEVGLYVYKKNDAAKPASWTNSGTQTLVASKPGTEWYTTFPTVLPAEVCGEGWAVQQDRVKQNGSFEWPATITPPTSALGGVLIDSKHHDLGDLIEVPACAVEPAPLTPSRPTKPAPETPAKPVTPVVPTVGDVCTPAGRTVDAPQDTSEITYERAGDTIVARPAAGYELAAAEGYVLAEDGTSATFAIDQDAAECALIPGDIGAVCEADTPYLGYEVFLPEGYVADSDRPLTITFLHPGDGEDYTVEGLPLDGTLLWPGASAGEPRAWPGWERQADGTYTETDGNYAWTRAGVEVHFEVNPGYSTTVSYPAATAACANPRILAATGPLDGPATPVSAEAQGGPSLAATGATAGAAAFLAVLLVGGGAGIVWARRRANA
ncbi:hypothetical protein [Oerskovia paurometabola]|uniref:Gram-positive cocci surface proteins LPxTG domain-containing protein n=1 Tax=Oerskovia paurometabola TaxID=162170 RepID=A0ABW1XBD9_9CELL|nr:hypothetical protein [Oerskovia paurometabola]MBM7498770.1 hypothetical protein [Oerskovia paurometabola]